MHVSFATIKATTSKHHFETDKNGVHSPPGSKSILADNWPHPDKQKLVYLNSKDWLIGLIYWHLTRTLAVFQLYLEVNKFNILNSSTLKVDIDNVLNLCQFLVLFYLNLGNLIT